MFARKPIRTLQTCPNQPKNHSQAAKPANVRNRYEVKQRVGCYNKLTLLSRDILGEKTHPGHGRSYPIFVGYE